MTGTKIMDTYLQSSKDMTELLCTLQSEVDDDNLILSDLDHFLELEELSHIEVANLTVRRKKILEGRRSAKDQIWVINQILPKQVEGRTTQDRYEFAIRNLESRVYSPRRMSLKEATGEL